jgi:hypothetical protein
MAHSWLKGLPAELRTLRACCTTPVHREERERKEENYFKPNDNRKKETEGGRRKRMLTVIVDLGHIDVGCRIGIEIILAKGARAG